MRLHSYPNSAALQASEQNIAGAKALGKTSNLVSTRGLPAVDKFGQVTNVHNGENWMSRNNE
jgi:hypothetical protein